MLKAFALAILLIVQLAGGMSHAVAATTPCTISGTGFNLVVASNIFPRDAPIGTQSAPYSTTVLITCIPDNTARTLSVYTYVPSGVAVPGFTNYYQTNIPDIAVRYIAENGPSTSCAPYSGGWPSQMLQITRTISCPMPASSTGVAQVYNLKYTAYFMKVGNAPTGNLTTIPPVTIQQYLPNTGTIINVFSGVASGTFAIAACSITTPAIAVSMPKTYTYRLPKVGSTDGETNLNIALNCDAGVKVYATLSDVSTPANKTTTLSLSSDSTAKGLGYQILFNGTPVVFGLDAATPGNPGQFLASPTQTTGGALMLPLTARYIRTGTIGTGSANAKATFTMSYQ